jgi:hypothetical protein
MSRSAEGFMTKRAEEAAAKAKRILRVTKAAWFEAIDLFVHSGKNGNSRSGHDSGPAAA